MSAAAQAVVPSNVRSIRWYICLLLFASTVINYLDRQTLSLLAPFLKLTYHWTNSDYANLVIGFYFTKRTAENVTTIIKAFR